MKLIILLLAATPLMAELVTAEVAYESDGLTMKGYLAYNDQFEGPRPGVLVVHEWWGHNDYSRKRAEMLADLGYTALAVDMYGDGKQADHPEDAGKFVQEVFSNFGAALKRFNVAMELLKSHPTTDANRIAAIGYCFGGATVLSVAREGYDLKGVVSFHGSLGTPRPAEKGKVKARVLVCHGSDDPFVTPEQMAAFKAEMESAEVNYEVKIYEGAKHSFTNPDADANGKKFGMPLEYNKAADEASWADMKAMFKEIFK